MDNDNSKTLKKVGLIAGIVILPYVFAWFTLRKGYSTGVRAAAFVWLMFCVVAVISDDGQTSSDDQKSTTRIYSISQATKDAVDYQIIDLDDMSFPGRIRISLDILAPEATTREQFSATAAKAAIDIQKKHRADIVTVFLNPSEVVIGTGNWYSRAVYAPDKGGYSGKEHGHKLEVDVVDEVPSQKGIDILNAWYYFSPKFKNSDGLTDEDALRAYIGKKLEIEDPHLPYMQYDRYVEL